jgi:hypothetical protein
MRRNGNAPGVGKHRDLAQIRQAAAHRVGLQDRQTGIEKERPQTVAREMGLAADSSSFGG